MSHWEDWIGREQQSQDRLNLALAARWCATFDLQPPESGVMPQGIHLCLCTPDAPTSALGEDGHPLREHGEDGFLPPIPLPRRMWASSAIQFSAPIAVGAEIARISRIASIEEKSGKSGKLVFVRVDHETRANGEMAVREEQILVYRDAAAPDAPLGPPEPGADAFDPSGWHAHRALTPDPRLLLRYSALTFNSHRIHYDLPYAREVERYRGLVVHGPLIASLLLRLTAREYGENALESFEFRATSPAISGDALHLALRRKGPAIELGAFAGDGRQLTAARGQLRG